MADWLPENVYLEGNRLIYRFYRRFDTGASYIIDINNNDFNSLITADTLRLPGFPPDVKLFEINTSISGLIGISNNADPTSDSCRVDTVTGENTSFLLVETAFNDNPQLTFLAKWFRNNEKIIQNLQGYRLEQIPLKFSIESTHRNMPSASYTNYYKKSFYEIKLEVILHL